MKNTTLQHERIKKTFAVILAIVAVITLYTVPFIAALQNALAAILVRHGSITYDAHHYTRSCSLKAFTLGKCFPRI
jgi:hypothetical protein